METPYRITKRYHNVWQRVIWLFLLAFLLPGAHAAAASVSWSEVAGKTAGALDRSLQAYREGRVAEAAAQVDEAYFGPFEAEGMEAAIRLSISGQRAFEFEDRFRRLKAAYANRGDGTVASQIIGELKSMLNQDAAKLDGASGSTFSLFLSSFLIILREGFEAILVIGALTAYMVKSGNRDKVRVIHSAAVSAILASIAAAIIFGSLVRVEGARQELIEGLTMLLAVVVLFFVSFWLLGKAQAQAWQSYIEGKIAHSLTTGRMIALWSAAFLAVFREGAETILFYGALAGGADAPGAAAMLAGGFLLGCSALAIVYMAIKIGSVKIPIRLFFTVTGNFLYLLAIIFAGKAVNELQAAGAVGGTPVSGLPAVDFLGIFPTWETVGIQLLLVALFAAGLLRQQYRRRVELQASG